MRTSTHWLRFAWYGTLLAAAAGCLSGCASKPFVMDSIPARMKANPDSYRHVRILSLALTSRVVTDSNLTTNDLVLLSRSLGTNLLNGLTRVLGDKGYQVTHTCNPLCTAEDWEELDRKTEGLATEARTNLVTLGEEIYANQPNEKFSPSAYKLPPSVAALEKKLGQEEVDLLVLLDSSVFVESLEAKHKRDTWNWTGGAILTPVVVGLGLFGTGPGDLPLKHSQSWIAHTILIADARTLDVLYWNSRTFLHENPHNTGAMRAKFHELLANFAELPEHR